MKTKNYLRIAKIIAIASLMSGIVSCKKDKSTSEDKEIIENETGTENLTGTETSSYLASDNGAFINESFPAENGTAAEKPVIGTVTGNSTVISGGSNTLSISYSDAQDDLKDVLIGIKGKSGYYVIEKSKLKASTLIVPLLLTQDITGDFIITIALRDNANNISALYELPVTTHTAGTGDLQISLSWDQLNDVDLHLILPNYNEIYYGNLYGISETAYLLRSSEFISFA